MRQELKSLPKTLADDVARNLVMVARLLDEDAERAYAYSRVALRLAARVPAVREAAGFASYSTERYAEALAEFRATRRMTGSVDLWPVMADCERGLGRPERALEMAGAPEVQKLDKAGQVEMRLVAAGARQDLGQAEAAVVTLQSSELASNAVHPWTARLRYAYADALLAVGREHEARDWFAKALEADHNGSTDASDRLARLDGVDFVDAFGEDEDEDTEGGAADGASEAPHAPVVGHSGDDRDQAPAAGEATGRSGDLEHGADADEADDDAEGDDEPKDADAASDDDESAEADGEGDDGADAPAPAGADDDFDPTDEEPDASSFLDSPFRAPAPKERNGD
ncbi:tetratricopeptide repeat protein [Actinacidiphila yeochonensis]|uniref:tetratricopeptide repeat protein n=1 Tax=Actinacidiphila yeochonensis TaxID=89050 RepID=UPI001E599A85|nr:tetratricopeptide repeat protein [Actinacidiphila yeochonensis]